MSTAGGGTAEAAARRVEAFFALAARQAGGWPGGGHEASQVAAPLCAVLQIRAVTR